MNKRELDILSLLNQDTYISSGRIGKELKLSDRTVRDSIKSLSAELQKYGASVEAKPRYGYRLAVHDKEKFSVLLKKENSTTETALENPKERAEYLLADLLRRRDYVKMEDLCEQMYVSESTLSRTLKLAETLLRDFDLAIERKPYYGLKIIGREFDKRRLIAAMFVKRKSSVKEENEGRQEKLEQIGQEVRELQVRYNLSFSEIAFENFVDYVYVAVRRMKEGFFVEINEQDIPEIDVKDKLFVIDLMTAVMPSGIPYSKSEEEYMILFLAGKRIIGTSWENDSNFVIKEKTDRIALEILKRISADYQLDLINNFELRMTLNQHLAPMDIRIRFGIPLINPHLKEIRKNYPLAYEMGQIAGSIIAKNYGKAISNDEIGYLALIFELVIEKRQVRRKHNILIVCSTGKSTSRLLKYKYEQEFRDYLSRIYVSDSVGLESFDFSQVDYVFTTVPIVKKINVPIIEVGNFLEDDDIEKVTKALSSDWTGSVIDQYYGPERFIGGLNLDHKDDVLRYMCDRIMKKEKTDADFYDMVLEREMYVQMDVGNAIALPHPNGSASEYSFAYVAVLDHPIQWNDAMVQVVILVSIGRHEEDKTRRKNFYEATSRFALSRESVNSLIAHPTYETFRKLIEK